MNKKDIIARLEELMNLEVETGFSEELETMDKTWKSLSDQEKNAGKEVDNSAATEGSEAIASDLEMTSEQSASIIMESEPLSEEELALNEKYQQLSDQLKKKIAKLQQSKAAQESENLNIKRKIIEDLKAMTNGDLDSLGNAYKSFNDLREKWRLTGAVPFKQYQELQHEYRFLIEQFQYSIKIFRELKELDLKKNKQLKEELIERIKVLSESDVLKDLESGVRSIQNEWDEIGPTFDEDWLRLREVFKEYLNKVYQKIQAHHHNIYEEMMQNFTKKVALAEQVEAIDISSLTNSKAWEEATKQILQLQQEYKAIGFARKKDNEQAWERFRGACNKFFEGKNAFYAESKSQFDKVKTEKQQIIEKAAQWKDSTDWKRATEALIALQQEWKKSGSAGAALERRLWSQFKETCDSFFERKKQYFSSMEERQASNLQKRLSIITALQQFTATGNTEADLSTIKQITQEWENADEIPRQDKDRVAKLYQEALDAVYGKLSMDKEEVEKIRFKQKLQDIKHNDPQGELLKREKIQIKEKLNKLESTISQYENNLAFFSKSKNAGDLLKDTLQQVEQARKEAQVLKDRLKTLFK
jgi:hypothetical protein